MGLACLTPGFSQTLKSDFFVKVLSEELNRNINLLSLPNLGKPFFISYRLRNNIAQSIRAERGQILSPFSAPSLSRSASVELLVGDYHRNFDYVITDGSFVALPDEANADEIKRLLWLETDRIYKRTAQQYNATQAALKRVTVDPKELDLDDLSKISPVVKDYGGLKAIDEKAIAQWKPLLQRISALFIPHPKITSSSTSLSVSNSEEYLVSSEGTIYRKPASNIYLTISAATQGDDGNNIFETYNEYVGNINELPDFTVLEEKAKQLIEKIYSRENAKKFEGSYLGPVLFEEDAVPSLVATFFGYNLGVRRKSILYPDNSGTFYEDKLGQKLIASPLNLIATPRLADFQGKKITGNFEIDYDGVVPPDSLVLIERGVLKNLLNGRIPTKKFPVSQGFASGDHSYSAGVLQLTADSGIANNRMKQALIKVAKEEGLAYAFIVRGADLQYGQSPYIFKVDTATMKEELVTGLKFTNLNMRSLRRFIVASNERQLKNTPSLSVIAPESMIIGEVELEAENNVVKAKPIIVSNPLLDKKTTINTPKKRGNKKSASK